MKHSFVIEESTKKGFGVFSLHDNVHEAIFSYVVNNYKKEQIETVINSILDYFFIYIKKFRTYEDMEENILSLFHSHIHKFIAHPFLNQETKMKTSLILEKCTSCIGDFYTSEKSLLEAEKYYKNTNNIDMIIWVNMALARSYSFQGKNKKAIYHASKAIDLIKKNTPQNKKNLILSEDLLAHAYRENGDYEKSTSIYEMIFRDNKAFEDEVNSYYIKVMMSHLLSDIGRFGLAEKYLSEAIEIFERKGIRHKVAWAQHAMGEMLVAQKKYKVALPILEKSYAQYVKSYSENYPNTSCIGSLLGISYAHTGNKEKAHYHLSKSYNFHKKFYGENHYETAIVLYYMGLAEVQNKNHKMAEDLFNKSYKIFKDSNHPKAKLPMNELKKLYRI